MGGVRKARRAMLATAATAAVGLVTTSVAQAGFHTFGSDLEADADWAETHGADAFFFATRFPDGRDPTSPATGHIVQIRLKGIAVPSGLGPPLTEIHFQTMALHPDGRPFPQISSGPVLIPAGGDPNQITTYDMRAQNFCIGRGVHIVFTDEGGFDPAHGYPNGVPYQVFGRVPGAATRQLVVTAAGGEDTVVQGQELLLQAVVATGPDATGLCPGGTNLEGGNLPGEESGTPGDDGTNPPSTGDGTQPPSTGDGTQPPSTGGGTQPPSAGSTPARAQARALVLDRTARVGDTRRHVRVAVRCTGARRCRGRVRLTVARRVGARTRRVVLAAGGFRLRAGQTRTVSLRLTRAGRRILRRTSRVEGVRATAITRTGAGRRRSAVTVTVRR